MILIESEKGAGLAEQSKFEFEAGTIPTHVLMLVSKE
jgi:hypothetical protein